MKNLIILAVISTQSLSVPAFSPTCCRQGFGKTLSSSQSSRCSQNTRVQAAVATSPVDAKVQTKTEIPVSLISVCAGELCQCQGEQYEYDGGASDAAIAELQSLDLPFPIDEVGCLGACGMGTMIAIDYENGDSIMTDGLDSTLAELGIQRQNLQSASVEHESSENGGQVEAVGNINEEAASSVPIVASATVTNEIKENPKPRKRPLLADPRERMREEAADEVVDNPWMNMAGYLAKKATGKIFGSE